MLKSMNKFFIFCIIFIVSSYHVVNGQNKKKNEFEDLKIKWPYSKVINCKNDSYNYKTFFLDEEVYKYASDQLSDLRILDSQKDFVPYYIITGETKYKSSKVIYSSKIIGRKQEPKTTNTIFDFQLKPVKENISGNAIILSVPSRSYSKQIILYGRHSSTNWQEIKQDSIYSFEIYEKTKILFDTNVYYSFFRIKIIDNTDAIDIGDLKLEGTSEEKYQKLYKEKTLVHSVKENEKDNITTVTIENPSKLKVFFIKLKISGIFNRSYDNYSLTEYYTEHRGKRKKKISRNHISSGKFYNFDFKTARISNTFIDLSNDARNDDKIYIDIKNNNDKPLSISGVKVKFYIDKVVYKSTRNSSHALYLGNKNAEKPVYDISTYKKHIEKENMDECGLEGIQSGEGVDLAKKEFLSEETLKIILNIVIILISFVLIVFIVRKLAVKH